MPGVDVAGQYKAAATEETLQEVLDAIAAGGASDPDSARELTLQSVLAEVQAVLAQLQTTIDVSAASLPLPAGAATEFTLASLRDRTPQLVGTWGYRAGTTGTPSIPAGARVIGIAASAGGAAASFTINAGNTITVPANKQVAIEPVGNLVAPAIAFTGTDSYFVEFVS